LRGIFPAVSGVLGFKGSEQCYKGSVQCYKGFERCYKGSEQCYKGPIFYLVWISDYAEVHAELKSVVKAIQKNIL
jgi:hypothetical protein